MPKKDLTDRYQEEKIPFAAGAVNIDQGIALVENGSDINAFDDGLSFTPLHDVVKVDMSKWRANFYLRGQM